MLDDFLRYGVEIRNDLTVRELNAILIAMRNDNKLKNLARKIRYWLYLTTMNDFGDDIDKKKIDFNKFLTEIKAGHHFYRFVTKDDDPLLPTGRRGRFVSQREDVSLDDYRKLLNMGYDAEAFSVGSGAIGTIKSVATGYKEVENPENMDLYKLTLTAPLLVIDFERLRKAKRIPLRYTKPQHPTYQLFYGTRFNGILYRSSKEGYYPTPYSEQSEEYNLHIFVDWIKEYRILFEPKKIEKEERKSLFAGFTRYIQPLSVVNFCKPKEK